MNSYPDLLSDGIIQLRALEPSDIDTLLRWENDSRAWASSTTAAPFSRHIIEQYVLAYDTDVFASRQLRLMIVDHGHTAGAIDLFEFDPVNRRAGIGIVIDPSMRGRGIATGAIALFARLCGERLGIHQLWAISAVSNTPARHMLETARFAIAGRLKSWIRQGSSYVDAYFYHLILPQH